MSIYKNSLIMENFVKHTRVVTKSKKKLSLANESHENKILVRSGKKLAN